MKVNERDEVTATVGDSVAAVLESYRVFLVDERGLAAESVRCYLLDARVFLTPRPEALGVALGLSSCISHSKHTVTPCLRRMTASPAGRPRRASSASAKAWRPFS